MRFMAIGATVLIATLGGTTWLTGGTVSRNMPAPAPLPPISQMDRLPTLIRQLDDRRFEVRREADRLLRRMPTAILPHLQAELKTRPSLEVSRRLESIIQELSQVPWRTDLSAATAEARRAGKPLLIFSSDRRFGDPSMPMTATFADLELVGILREQFVPVWHVQKPTRFPTRVHIGRIRANTGLGMEEIDWPSENARTYVCSPEARILHYVEGNLKPGDYLDEVRHGRRVARQCSALSAEEGLASVRSALMIRDGKAAQRPHSFDRVEEQKILLVPDLLGQPIAPILDRLRARMFVLTGGC